MKYSTDKTAIAQAMYLTLIFMLCLGLLGTDAHAAEQSHTALAINVENDAFYGKDENYTAGSSLVITRNNKGFLGGSWSIVGTDSGSYFSTYEIAQLLFTPTETHLQVPDPKDRPYAGILYLGLTSHLQTSSSLQSIKLIGGVIGPYSLGESGQKTSHELFQSSLPQGWDYQIHNEPLIDLQYEYRHKFETAHRGDGFGIQLFPIGGGMLGNYLTKGHLELQLRIGYNLPESIGDTSIRGIGTVPLPDNFWDKHFWGAYLFGGAGADFVTRDITLDGNSFESSRSVAKRNFVPSGSVGVALLIGRLKSSYTYNLIGKEFYGQKEVEQFGAVNVTYYF
ncbi:DUF2219 family protein [Geobacter pelophilus]|uniref:DUF2219 family protein n=1 Tax=Geoanaerobacter pelophilus TaxID=60036 RepID=A0AAW4LDQ8_9BACT|nr:lipid A deacylase LpxR family protein [Geoanaerobacter pelophilus]MBT0666576.1 DUF2219 family protein [Geoanaerobacter pelophilus]